MTRKKQQGILEQFVAHNLYICQTVLVETCFQKHIFFTEDIQNLYRPFDARLLIPNTCTLCKKQSLCLDSETGECEHCFVAQQMPQKIDEWWAISPWLGKKLLMEGQPVLENVYGVWWGRYAKGQTISMDNLIQTIVEEVLL